MDTQLLKEIMNTLNTYIQKDEYMYIESIESKLKDFFNVDSVKLWKVNSYESKLKSFNPKIKDKVTIEKSITEQVIQSKLPLFENHLTSNKYYNTDIDNIESIKIRSLLIFPIIQHKEIVGLCFFYRKLGNNVLFNRQDYIKTSIVIPILLSLLNKEVISKNKILSILDLNKKNEFKNNNNTIIQKDKKIINTSEKQNNNLPPNDIDPVKEKYNKQILTYENYIKKSQEAIVKYQENESKYNINLELLVNNNKTLEDKLSQLTHDYSLLNKKVLDKSTEIKSLTRERNKINSEIESYEMLKTEKVIEQHDYSSEQSSYQKIMQEFRDHFGAEQHSRVVFELIISAIYSSRGINMLEDILAQSDIVHTILNKYSLRQTIPVNHESFKVTDLIQTLSNYEKFIFNNEIKINIECDYGVPKSLFFDSLKIENMILYLLLDSFQFIDHNHDILIRLKYENRYLVLTIKTKVHQKNSVFNQLLKKDTIFSSSGRVSLEYTQRLLGYLNGRLECTYKGNDYSYIVHIPAKTIKL